MCELIGFPKVDEHPAAVIERLGGVHVAGRHNCLARAERVGECAAGDLVRVEVRCDVDIGREQELDDVLLAHVLIDERDMIVHPERMNLRDERVAIVLALHAEEVGMRLARDEVERVGMPAHDLGHRGDHELEPFTGVDQAEGGDDRPAFDAELRLEGMPSARRDHRHAVRNHPRGARESVVVCEDRDGAHRHDDHRVAQFVDAAHRLENRWCRGWQHRVHRRDDRLAAAPRGTLADGPRTHCRSSVRTPVRARATCRTARIRARC